MDAPPNRAYKIKLNIIRIKHNRPPIGDKVHKEGNA